MQQLLRKPMLVIGSENRSCALASGLAIFDDLEELLHPAKVGGSSLVDHVTHLVPLHGHGQRVLLPGLDVGEDEGHYLVDQGLPLVPLHDPGQLALLPDPDEGLEDFILGRLVATV